MIDDLTNEILDTLLSNEKIKEKLYPIVYGVVAFNVLVLILIIYIIFLLKSK